MCSAWVMAPAGTVGWNAAGGALGNWIDNKDPLSGAISNGIGSAAGYGIGKGITWGQIILRML